MEHQNDLRSSLSNDPALIPLFRELDHIQDAYNLTLEKTTGLTAEIRRHEARLAYFDASMTEGQRLAAAVLREAELRVENITTGSNRQIIPQRKLIDNIENEITELSQILESLNAAADKSAAAPDNLALLAVFSHKHTPKTPASANSIHPQHHLPNTLAGADSIPSHQLNTAPPLPDSSDLPANQAGLLPPDPQAGLVAEEPAPNFINTAAVPPSLPLKLSQPSPLDNAETCSEPMAEAVFNIKPPVIPAEKEMPEEPEYSKEEMIDNSLLHLDVALQLSFYDDEDHQPESLRKHEWLIKMIIKIPEDNDEFVRCGKVPQDIKSILLRYDNTILNDLYPFNIITPSRPNISMYFFNCLEDNVAFMNLRLREIAIWENQCMLHKVTHRNKALDEVLQSGDDMLENPRDNYRQ